MRSAAGQAQPRVPLPRRRRSAASAYCSVSSLSKTELEALARQRIRDALTPRGRLFIDGGDPLREIRLR